MLKAGSDAIACKTSELGLHILQSRRWPLICKGGRITDVYKRKGSKSDCDNSRGILLSCHLFKILFGIIMQQVNLTYCAFMPCTQFGAVEKRGSDFATHVVISSIQVARLRNWSIFIMFIDLTKAFDRIVRELAIGLTLEAAKDPVNHFFRLGLSATQSSWMAQFVAEN